ncbi:DapH/DapD/GlmU-related protein [Pectobacterium brasiliense]|uniref:acyltransferase n=1 Tax=Pectobacterium brasiliense TaxID=180957 RepID=UPI0004E75E10|nr:acyltransferase [Pectobacterium brasiliense]KFF63336.1 acetyltransferase [Pectobacterium brasiliense]MBN3097720.1 acyltransferase [Pectobacterium brasiliense]MBN3101197.1 acyltransferase [Pectobacterium brasiliense]MBN3122576.1 acyltransferase [Pectobacterium brasiliense]MBN3140613.1 acyltransferase [Pectobacterium brasiliense]
MIFHKINSVINLVFSQVIYSFLMSNFGKKSRIINPMIISNHKNISIGNNVLIRDGVRLEVIDPQNEIVINIGDNVNIEQNVHIVGRCGVHIGNNVSITGGCSIVDVIHPYADINDVRKIGERLEKLSHPVYVGDDTFIGYSVHINPGVRIGKYCIIGAHSVITKDVPDYSVVAGNPARIIKKYNFDTNSWQRCV